MKSQFIVVFSLNKAYVDIMKICMWSFGGNKVKFDRRITALFNIIILAAFT